MFYCGRRSRKRLAGHEGGGRRLEKKNGGCWWFKPWPFLGMVSSRDPFQGVIVTSKKGMKRALWILNHLADFLFSIVSVFFSLCNLLTVYFLFGERFVVVVFFYLEKRGGIMTFPHLTLAYLFCQMGGWATKLDGRIVQETCWRSEETCITPVGLEYDSMLTPLPWCPYNKKTNRYKSGEQRIIECDLGVWHVISLRVEIIPPVMSFT